jgi:hypothetical protein
MRKKKLLKLLLDEVLRNQIYLQPLITEPEINDKAKEKLILEMEKDASKKIKAYWKHYLPLIKTSIRMNE